MHTLASKQLKSGKKKLNIALTLMDVSRTAESELFFIILHNVQLACACAYVLTCPHKKNTKVQIPEETRE